MNAVFKGKRTVLALVCSMGAGLAYADGHAIDGVINDALGRPLAGATVTLKALNGQQAASTTTDAKGHFHFADLPPSQYQINASLKAFEAGATTVTVAPDSDANTSLTLASEGALDVAVKHKALDRARNGISVDTGSSSYHISQKDIQNLPQGGDTSFNQVVLQAPGVVQDSFGQLHVRGDHNDLQYRLDGIILPESISGFGQALDTHFLQSVTLLTGALPAEYGYRTAGVITMQTKDGAFGNGGDVGLTVGSNNSSELNGDVYGSSGNFNYYMSADGLRNNLGIENPTPVNDPQHDHTQEGKGFGYFSWLLGDSSRLSLIVGSTNNRFQIPDNPGQVSSYQDGTITSQTYPSGNLQDNQQESTQYGILAFQSSVGDDFDYQVSLFNRYTSVQYNPDVIGNLIYNGSATAIDHSGWDTGIQADGSYRLNPGNTLRMGTFLSDEKLVSDNTIDAFPLDGSGNPETTPTSFTADGSKNAYLEGVYLQDEWKATDRLTVNYGARYDEVNAYVRADQLSPRLGTVYQLTADTTLHAGFARYFTPPPTELVTSATIAQAQNTTDAPALSTNGTVKPESDDYYDVGISHNFTPQLTMGLDAYLKHATNLLDEGQFGPAVLFTPFNYAEGKVAGQEFTANFRQDNFSAYFNVAHSEALGKDLVSSQYAFAAVGESPAVAQEQLNYIANTWIHLDHDETLAASGGASYMWWDTTYAADFIAGSGLRNDPPTALFPSNSTHLPGYTQVNLSARRTFDLAMVGKVEGRVSVVNLLDRVYEIRDGSGVGVGAPQYGPQRGYFLSVNKSF